MWQDIILGNWYSFKPYMASLTLTKNYALNARISISSTEIESLNGVEKRDDCISNFIRDLDCPRICSPLKFNYLNFNQCTSNFEANCMEDKITFIHTFS